MPTKDQGITDDFGVTPLIIVAHKGHCEVVSISTFGFDHNRQITGWHEKSGGEHLENIEFIFFAVILLYFGHYCSFRPLTEMNYITEMEWMRVNTNERKCE